MRRFRLWLLCMGDTGWAVINIIEQLIWFGMAIASMVFLRRGNTEVAMTLVWIAILALKQKDWR